MSDATNVRDVIIWLNDNGRVHANYTALSMEAASAEERGRETARKFGDPSATSPRFPMIPILHVWRTLDMARFGGGHGPLRRRRLPASAAENTGECIPFHALSMEYCRLEHRTFAMRRHRMRNLKKTIRPQAALVG